MPKLFLPDEESWLRHAIPWSVWTRFITLPFLILAVWSRVWIGWYCLVPISVLVVWIFVNPRIFDKPSHYNSWGSKAVLGERIYIQRKMENKLGEHKIPIIILTAMQTLRGGCHCKQLRVTAIDEPEHVYVCHCEECQRRTGSKHFWIDPPVILECYSGARGVKS